MDGSTHDNCQFEVDTFWDVHPVITISIIAPITLHDSKQKAHNSLLKFGLKHNNSVL